jgi:drug/metabolite transporter (DMT)-like permease
MLETLILIVLIQISSIFFVYANFMSKLPGNKKKGIIVLTITAILFVTIEYLIKSPAIFYFGQNKTSVFIYSILIATTFLATLFFSHFLLHETIHLHTYIIVILIIGLLILNEILSLHK